MIIVTVDITLEEDCIDGLRDAFLRMDAASTAEEGCIRYVSSADVNNPRIVRIYEQWETLESLQAHFATPHMAEFQQAFADVKTAGMSAKVYEVARELPFPN